MRSIKVRSVNTIGLILLAIVVFLLLRIRFSPTFMASSSNDWLILEWHELDSATHCLIVLGLIYKAVIDLWCLLP